MKDGFSWSSFFKLKNKLDLTNSPLSDTDNELREISAQLGVLNGQFDEILGKSPLIQKIQNNLRILDDVGGDVESFGIRLAFRSVTEALKSTLEYSQNRQKQVDAQLSEMMHQLLELMAISNRLSNKWLITAVLAWLLVLAAVIPTIIQAWIQAGGIPFT